MKKLLLFLLLTSLLIFGGCSFFQKKEEPPQATPEETVLEKRTGIVSTVEDQGIVSGTAPYVLLTENGEKVFINSLSVNLKRYTGRRVEIEGIADKATQVLDVLTVTSLGQETLVKKNYQDSEMGIKLSLPSVWHVEESKNLTGLQKIVITPYEVTPEEAANVDTITIERTENNKRLSPREWLKLDEFYRPFDPLDTDVVYQQATIGVGQLAAVKKTYTGGQRIEFFVQRDTWTYILSHSTIADADKDLYRNAFFEIVGSFEFIPFAPQTTPKETPKPPQKTSEETAKPSEQPKIAEPVEPRSETNEANEMSVAPFASAQDVQSKAYGVSFQLPKSWYWAYSADGYKLDAKEVEDTSTEFLALFFRTRGHVEGEKIGLLQGNPLYMKAGDKAQYCLQRDTFYYCVDIKNNEETTVAKQLLFSIKEI